MHTHITHTKAEEPDGGEGNGHEIAAQGTNSQKDHLQRLLTVNILGR
jgi:hypothetical protein